MKNSFSSHPYHKNEEHITKLETVKKVLDEKRPPYVPWHFVFAEAAAEKLNTHFGTSDLEPIADNHLIRMGSVLDG